MLKKIVLAVLLTGCQTVTVRPGGGAKLDTEPNFSETKHFFLFGLVPGSSYVDLHTACGGKGVEQLQARNSFFQVILSSVTFGLYNPRTAQVWCSAEAAPEGKVKGKTKGKRKAKKKNKA
ncbi:MAG: Bor family protein [Oligoflexales bacterium]